MITTVRYEMEKPHMLRIVTVVITVLMLLGLPARATAQTETVIYFHTDAVGSVRMTTDANGQVLQRYDYTPFGEPWPSQPTPETRRFGGQELDAETQLNYFGARLYLSQTGRFTRSDDPGYGNLFDPQSMNVYAYAHNNPLRWVDPTGHLDCDIQSQDPEHFVPWKCVEGLEVVGASPDPLARRGLITRPPARGRNDPQRRSDSCRPPSTRP